MAADPRKLLSQIQSLEGAQDLGKMDDLYLEVRRISEEPVRHALAEAYQLACSELYLDLLAGTLPAEVALNTLRQATNRVAELNPGRKADMEALVAMAEDAS